MDKERGLLLTELYEGVSVEDVKTATGCPFEVHEAVQLRLLSDQDV